MNAPGQPGGKPQTVRDRVAWTKVVGYFVIFFAATSLSGVMFTLGGITIVLVPGSLPLWLVVAYVCLGAAGSVFVGWLATDRAFHIVGRLPQRAIMDGPAAQGTAAQAAAPAGERRRRVLVWAAGVAGTALAGTISAVLAVLVLDWLGR